MSQLQITKPQTMVQGKKYYHLSIPNCGDWMNATILPNEDSQTAVYTNGNYDNHVFYEDGDSVNETLITALMMEIRTLAAHKACIEVLCHPKRSNVQQQLYWVYAENKSHVCTMSVKHGLATPVNMYAVNCFYSEDEAKAFYLELKALFAKYGV